MERDEMLRLVYNARTAQNVSHGTRAPAWIALDELWVHARSTVFPVAMKEGWYEEAAAMMHKADEDYRRMAGR